MEQEKLYVIEEKTYEAHIDEEVHLYGLLHQLAFLAGKIKDREDVEAFIAAAKRYGQIADDKFDAWNIPGRYLVFGDKADLAGMKARELCELDAFYVECEDDEPEPGSGRQEEHYLIPGSGFRLLVSELHMFLVTWYSIAKCLSQAQNEKDFLRLQKKYGNYEKTLNRLRRKLGLSDDSNFCQDELEAAVIKRFRAELIPGEQISHEYDTSGVSHVGIYVGDGMMLHCGDPIQYSNLNTSYWQSHFYAYGRPPYN